MMHEDSNGGSLLSAPSNNAYSYANHPRALHEEPFANQEREQHGRRLSVASISKEDPPSYMKELFEDLKGRKKLMEDTPPEEVKYWFEYTGPLQVSFA